MIARELHTLLQSTSPSRFTQLLPVEKLKGKLPTAKQLADIVRAEMEGGK